MSCSPAEGQSEKKEDESYDFVCDIGNPLPAGARADFGVKLIGANVDANSENVEVRMSVNSTNPEEASNTRDNEHTVRVDVEVKALLGLSGRSKPEQLDFVIGNRTAGVNAVFDFDVGPIVSHLYQVSGIRRVLCH